MGWQHQILYCYLAANSVGFHPVFDPSCRKCLTHLPYHTPAKEIGADLTVISNSLIQQEQCDKPWLFIIRLGYDYLY